MSHFSTSPFFTFSELQDLEHNDSFQENDAICFDMYVKKRELEQINLGLQRVMNLSQAEKHLWLSHNESFIEEMMESLLHETLETFDGIQLDTKALALSTELDRKSVV